MPTFLDTTGKATLAIAICGRCSRKFPYDELYPDPNYPGLRVCRDDLDDLEDDLDDDYRDHHDCGDGGVVSEENGCYREEVAWMQPPLD